MELPSPVPGDAFRMLMDNGQVVIEFGRIDRSQSGAGSAGQTGAQRGDQETSVLVTDRVALPLDVARRLLHTLEQSLKPLEAELRIARARDMAPADAGLAARPNQTVARPTPDQSGEQAARLLRLVGAWGVPHQYERSFRMSVGSLQSNRFLLTVNASDIPGDARQTALAVCDQMGMPPIQLQAAMEHFGMANAVHFGFEGDSGSVICKLYLERAVPSAEARRAHATGEPVLLHLSYKWDLLRGEHVTTRYLWHPLLTQEEIALRIGHVCRAGSTEARDIALDFLRLASGSADAETLQYLEVEELENDRRSFDLNLYNAKLSVKDAQAQLQRMRGHFGLRPGQFQALYDQIKAMSLGHLAGGVHRNGKDFFNVYYGVVGLPNYNKKL
jgi:tryptophan halogenase